MSPKRCEGPSAKRRKLNNKSLPLETMSPPNNPQLPDEILEEIFSFLDAKSLLNCTLVNKSYNEVISQSSKLMAKLPIFVKAENMRLDRFTRKYITVNSFTKDPLVPRNTLKQLKIIMPKIKNYNFLYEAFGFELLACCCFRVVRFIGIRHVSGIETEFNFIYEIIGGELDFISYQIRTAQYMTWPDFRRFLPRNELVLQDGLIGNFVIDTTKTKNEHMKKLKMIDVRFTDPRAAAAMYDLTPGVTEVEIFSDQIDNVWKALQPLKMFRNLKKLVIKSNHNHRNHSYCCDFNSTSLEVFELKSFDGLKYYNWQKIFQQNPKLKCVELHVVNNGHLLNINTLLKQMRDGMKIKVSGSFVLTKPRLRALKAKKTVTMKISFEKVKIEKGELKKMLEGQENIVEFI